MKFSLELTENDTIHVVPEKVIDQLTNLISDEAKRVLASGEYVLTMKTGTKGENRIVQSGDSTFRFSSAEDIGEKGGKDQAEHL